MELEDGRYVLSFLVSRARGRAGLKKINRTPGDDEASTPAGHHRLRAFPETTSCVRGGDSESKMGKY
jgi:hypothetical protein